MLFYHILYSNAKNEFNVVVIFLIFLIFESGHGSEYHLTSTYLVLAISFNRITLVLQKRKELVMLSRAINKLFDTCKRFNKVLYIKNGFNKDKS